MTSSTSEVATRCSKARKLSSAELIDELTHRTEDLRQKELNLKTLEQKLVHLTKDPNDVLEINAGGKVFAMRRSTLCLAEGSVIAALFSGNWDDGQHRDSQGRPFLDVDPYIFDEIVNFPRQKAIEGPEKPAPIPIIAPEKELEFDAVVDYYGLKECLHGGFKVQSFSLPGEVKSHTDAIALHRGYAIHVAQPLRLRAVLVGADSPVHIVVGRGNREVVAEVQTNSIQNVPSALQWRATESVLNQVALFDLGLRSPPDAFIMVRFQQGTSFSYAPGSNDYREAGPFSVVSKGELPLVENSYSLCMRIAYQF